MFEGNYEFLGVKEFGNEKKYHSLVMLGETDTFEIFLNDEMFKIIQQFGFKRRDVLTLAVEVAPQVVTQNGRNVTMNTIRLVGLKPYVSEKPAK